MSLPRHSRSKVNPRSRRPGEDSDTEPEVSPRLCESVLPLDRGCREGVFVCVVLLIKIMRYI